MKNFIRLFILIIAVAISGCQIQKMTSEQTEKEKAAVKSVLNDYVKSIENEDIGLYSKIFIHDPGMVNFGTGNKEKITGWDNLKKAIEDQNAALSGTKITQSDVNVNLSPDGQIAWATSLWNLSTKMDTTSVELPVRCSWILEKTGGEWKFIHFHKSVGTM